MTLDDEEEDAEARSTWTQFSNFFKKGTGKERGRKVLPMAPAPGPLNAPGPADAFGEMRKKLAIKCDLCAGYSNQACVQACPTGAAIRVNPIAFFGSTDEILRRRAK
jgi:Fe-S-cluster-containing hydrogenase component 2